MPKKMNFIVKLVIVYALSFLVLCIVIGLFHTSPYNSTVLTMFLWKPIAILAFVPVGFYIEREVKKKYAALDRS